MRALLATIAILLTPVVAMAGDLSRCEIVVVNDVVDEDGGRMTVASYRAADGFIAGVYDADINLVIEDNGHAIRGLICVRNDLVPTEKDYAILATGIPLSLSQDFDSEDSDILTLYFSDGAFRHKYTSDYPMSGELEEALIAQLSDFSARDHGLVSATTNE